MKFWAKVRFSGEENVKYLICAFFKDFNSKSSITIKGKEGKLEIIFDRPPMSIIQAMNYCDVIEFHCGKPLEEYTEDETEQDAPAEETAEQIGQDTPAEETAEKIDQDTPAEETAEKIDQNTPAEETAEKTDQDTPAEETAEKIDQDTPAEETAEKIDQDTSAEETAEKIDQDTPAEETAEKTEQDAPAEEPAEQTDQEDTSIPELIEIAKNSTSYEEFIKSITEWLTLGKRQEFFENVVMAAGQAQRITWNHVEAILKSNGVTFSSYDKIWCTKQVAAKFKDSQSSVTFMKLIKAVVSYRTFDFHQIVTEAEEPVIVEEEAELPKNMVKMECMLEIPCFEETLGSVDKTQPIEERVRYVLAAMGWERTMEPQKQWILEIANTAVCLKGITFEAIILQSHIPMESTLEAKMTFSQFINDFVKASGYDQKVKVLDFLKDLQRAVMSESEIDSLTNF